MKQKTIIISIIACAALGLVAQITKKDSNDTN